MVLTNHVRFPIAVTMFDAADLPIVRGVGVRWHADWREGIQNYYVKATVRNVNGKYQTVSLHRLLLQTPEGLHTDHINNNSLDNRRSNLRPATCSENARNYRPGGYDSLRGRTLPKAPKAPRRIQRVHVWREDGYTRWRIRVILDGVRHPLGSAPTKEEALARGQELLDMLLQRAA